MREEIIKNLIIAWMLFVLFVVFAPVPIKKSIPDITTSLIGDWEVTWGVGSTKFWPCKLDTDDLFWSGYLNWNWWGTWRIAKEQDENGVWHPIIEIEEKLESARSPIKWKHRIEQIKWQKRKIIEFKGTVKSSSGRAATTTWRRKKK